MELNFSAGINFCDCYQIKYFLHFQTFANLQKILTLKYKHMEI